MYFGNVVIIESKNTAAEELLLQEGLCFEKKELSADLNIKPSVWILDNKRPSPGKISYIKNLIAKGHIFICDQDTKGFLKDRIGFITPEELRDEKGGLFVFENNFKDFYDDFKAVKKNFAANEISAKETVALNRKSVIRENLCLLIKEIFFKKNISYVHLWYYPPSYDSIASFRVDLDEYYKEDIKNLIEWGRDFAESMTWFVCCSALEKDTPILTQLKEISYDIQSHGYFHHVYNTVDENIDNLKRSNEFLKRFGIEPKGFAGPMGKWNRTLSLALERLNFKYSSEFGFDYDNLPSYPVNSDMISKTLQIPIHPLCLGSFLEAGASVDNISEYFKGLIDGKLVNNEPIILYGHPEKRLGRHKDFFVNIMKKLYSVDSIKKMNFSDIYKWWIQRRNFKFSVIAEKDRIKFYAEKPSVNFSYRIEFPYRREAFVNCNEKEILLSSLHFRSLKQKHKYYKETAMPNSLKDNLRSFIDWEEVTPVSSIKRDNIKGVMKYVARHIRAKKTYGRY